MRTTLLTPWPWPRLFIGPSRGRHPGAQDRRHLRGEPQGGASSTTRRAWRRCRPSPSRRRPRSSSTAIKLDRLLVLAHYQLGEARMALKDYPEAVEALEACIAAHMELVALQSSDRDLSQKRLDEEIEALKDSLQASRQEPEPAACSPRTPPSGSRTGSRARAGSGARGTMPTEVPAEFSLALGSAYLRSGRMDDAEKAYGEAIKVNPKMGEAHNNLAFVYFRTGRLRRGRERAEGGRESRASPSTPASRTTCRRRRRRRRRNRERVPHLHRLAGDLVLHGEDDLVVAGGRALERDRDLAAEICPCGSGVIGLAAPCDEHGAVGAPHLVARRDALGRPTAASSAP